jgi:hypothetical protein
MRNAFNPMQERELETIRKQYLGGVRNTKRVVKAADKFKAVFQFDWDATGTQCTIYIFLYSIVIARVISRKNNMPIATAPAHI